MTIPPFAPGCFGSALAFNGTHPVCQSCTFSEQCRPLHEQNLAALRERFAISERRRPVKLPEAEAKEVAAAGMTLPKKVRELVERIDKMGLHITENLSAGKNPFDKLSTLKFMRVAAHILLKLDRPLRHGELTRVYLKAFPHWGKTTADPIARQALQILQYIGAVDQVDGGFTLRRTHNG